MRNNTLKSVISGKGVKVGQTPIVVGGENCSRPPKVSLNRQGSDISSIRIECGCGEVIVLDCSYDQPTTAPAT